MARSIQKIEYILLAVMGIIELNGMGFNCNALLSLEVHAIQHLSLHVALFQRMSQLQQPVCQCAFTVVNMGYYTKIPNVLHKWRKGNYFFIFAC